MKKYFFVLFLGMFMINSSFSQMSFNDNLIKKSAFDLTGGKKYILSDNSSAGKIIFTNDENNLTKGRRRGGRGGSSDGGVFINIAVGYGLGLGSQNINGFIDKTSDTSTISTESQVDVSLGKGLCIKLGFGYMINSNFGFELGAAYLLGGKTTATEVSPFFSGINQTIASTYSSSMIMINPSIVVASGMDIMNPYAKFGMIIGFGSFSLEKSKTADTFSVFQKTKYDGGIAIGFNATLGCAYTLSDNISLFAEFSMLNISYSPDKSELTEYTSQGKDQLPTLTVKDKQTNYYETIATTSLTPIPNTVPNQALKQSYSFGNIGFNVGMKINF